jgi:hypothetical protein
MIGTGIRWVESSRSNNGIQTPALVIEHARPYVPLALGAAGVHGLNVGSYCNANITCPIGLFCNGRRSAINSVITGESHGLEGFCEPCLSCGVPDDSWAGCSACGLPDEGEADCVASCNANPGVVAATEWRVANGLGIEDHWIVSEVEMFSDRECSIRLTPDWIAVSSMEYGVACTDDMSGRRLQADCMLEISVHISVNTWGNEIFWSFDDGEEHGPFANVSLPIVELQPHCVRSAWCGLACSAVLTDPLRLLLLLHSMTVTTRPYL